MKFFVKEIPFEIVEDSVKVPDYRFNVVFGNATAESIFNTYTRVADGKIIGKPHFYFKVNNYAKTVEDLVKRFTVIQSAGGLVLKGNDMLFIYRYGKWDLPKGKIEFGEQPNIAAVREVEEECGVKAQITDFIGSTYHTYRMFDQEVLKETFWYEMICLEDTQLTPQIEEGISQVVWMSAEEIRQKALQNTYDSIREIYAHFDAHQKRKA